MDSNSFEALDRRRDAGILNWHGPALMLFARAGFAVLAQGVAAAVFFLRGSPSPWRDARPWLPVYGTLIDGGCLLLLHHLIRKEGLGLPDLIKFERSRLPRDILLGFVLVPLNLVCILAGVYPAGWLVYGTLKPPYLYDPLPLAAALYGTLVWPFLWGLTEQMTYNGYLVSRFQILARNTTLAVAVVAFVWSLQHSVMPVTGDHRWVVFRMLSPIPNTVFSALVYLRWRRLLPLAISHALLDGGGVLIGVLLPALRG